MNTLASKLICVAALASGLALSGCVEQPYHRGYVQQGYGAPRPYRCQCGVVQDVQQLYSDRNSGNGTLGAVIGAVAGGVLGSTIGKGDGRTAATVGGAVVGGVVGNQVGNRSGGGDVVWRIVVQLDNGQYATVTQRPDPGVRNGDYVEVRDGLVYRR
jgi:outer membrane lipoprotein SlyB